jgi:fructose-bisphosphate aldolase class II
MAYITLRELLPAAAKGGYAVGAFNIFNYLTMRAVISACEDASSPVIIQTSVKTVKQFGVTEMMDFMEPLARRARIPVAIHLDHCTDTDFAKSCVDAGWSSIMIDGSHHPFETNIAMTKEIVDYTKNRNVSVEGELGAIVGVEDDISVDEKNGMLADVENSKEYVNKTGVDAFTPAIGTAHGVYKGEPKLDFDLFSDIKSKISTPLVVHGGTGLADDVFKRLISIGASKINVSTAIKIAYLTASKDVCEMHNDPLKFDAAVFDGVKASVRTFLDVFGSVGKA